jgi:uncharacterized protein (UPF0548 family)
VAIEQLGYASIGYVSMGYTSMGYASIATRLRVYIGKTPIECAVQATKAGLCWKYPVIWPEEAESARLSGFFIGKNTTYVPEKGERSPYPAENPI